MNPRDFYKNRIEVKDASPYIVDFFKELKELIVSVSDKDFPIVESVFYSFVSEKHLLIVMPSIKINKYLLDNTKVSIFAQSGYGKGAKKLFANSNLKLIDKNDEFLVEFSKNDNSIKHFIGHGANFFEINFKNAILQYSPVDVFEIDSDLIPRFATHSSNGIKRYENSRKLYASYLESELILNVYIENGIYYFLTSLSSNKINHILNEGSFKVYDGVNNVFDTVFKREDDLTDYIFNKLEETNNNFFNKKDGLVAISFEKKII